MNPHMVDLVAHGIDARTLVVAPMPGDWQEFGWGDRDEPGPQTENSIERGFRHQEPVDNELGHSDSFDPDDVGDIADETPGHRG